MAVAKAGTALASARRPKVKVRGGYTAAQRPVVTTMAVTVGLVFLSAWLVEKKPLPERSTFVRLGILGFVLALLSETVPRLGKGMSYLVLTGVVFDRSQAILRELDRPPAKQENRPGPGPSPFTPDTRPVTLYVRQGPMTTEPAVPARSRIKSPRAGAAFQNII